MTRPKFNVTHGSVTRHRESVKASSDGQVWSRLSHGARIVLLACSADRITGMSNRIASELEQWGCVVPRAEGHALTAAGIRVRDFGKSDNE